MDDVWPEGPVFTGELKLRYSASDNGTLSGCASVRKRTRLLALTPLHLPEA